MQEGNWSAESKEFFKDISNSAYQNNAKELVYLLPSER